MTRSLKVEDHGDPYRGGARKSKIRLCRGWLNQAGFAPGQRVTVTVDALGRLIIEASKCSQISPISGELETAKTLVFSRIDAALASVQQTPDL